jgi:hypothetical protein
MWIRIGMLSGSLLSVLVFILNRALSRIELSFN